MYSALNQEKQRLFWTLENEICKYITTIPKNVYINELDKIVDKNSKT